MNLGTETAYARIPTIIKGRETLTYLQIKYTIILKKLCPKYSNNQKWTLQFQLLRANNSQDTMVLLLQG
jgi:hypothetical protein